MASNDNQNLTNAELLAKGTQASTVIGAALGAYGTSAAQDAALTLAVAALSAGITDRTAAKAAALAATQDQLFARDAILASLGSIGATIYNNPTVSDDMIATAGFAIHDDVPTPHAPVQPLGLSATPDSFGTVLFEWDGNGNVYPTIYLLEGRASDTDPWTTVSTTTRKRIFVPGFTPGVTYWFRVSASRNGASSIASNDVSIWGLDAVPLQIAA